jgi:hypothetical protein
VYRRGGPGPLGAIYFFVGAFMAGGDDYLKNTGDIKAIVSGVLAIILCPLTVVGVNLLL